MTKKVLISLDELNKIYVNSMGQHYINGVSLNHWFDAQPDSSPPEPGIEEVEKRIDTLISESLSTGSMMRVDDKAVTLKLVDIAKEKLIRAVLFYGQECTARAKGQKTFKQVLDDNYCGII